MFEPTEATQAIVLTTTPLNDRSQLVRLYTQTQGRTTCRVPINTRCRQGSHVRMLMAPMTLIEAEISRLPHQEMGQIREAQLVSSPYMLTQQNPGKSVFFPVMAELLAQTIREVERNDQLWDFLTGSLEVLQLYDEHWENFLLVFTSGLTAQLGFDIGTQSYSDGYCFDMQEGVFLPSPPCHPYYLNSISAYWWHQLFSTDYTTMQHLQLQHNQRLALFEMQLSFLSLQIPEMGRIKSVELLKEL